MKRIYLLFILLLLPLISYCVGVFNCSRVAAADLQGDVRVHDPTMIKQGKTYYVFSTGSPNRGVNQGHIQIRTSDDRIRWRFQGIVLKEIPTWISAALGSQPKSLWAPDISYFNGKYHLYYSASFFGSNNSLIALATNRTLDPDSPNYQWVDEGIVIRSTTADDWNAIDPHLSFDSNGELWLSFGSFWSGIKMRRLNRSSGKLAETDTTLYSLAGRPGKNGGGPIEAPSIIHRNNYYYLFFEFYQFRQQ